MNIQRIIFKWLAISVIIAILLHFSRVVPSASAQSGQTATPTATPYEGEFSIGSGVVFTCSGSNVSILSWDADFYQDGDGFVHMDFDAVAIRSSGVMGFACFFWLPAFPSSFPVTAYWWETDIVQGSNGVQIDHMRLGYGQDCYSEFGAGLGGPGTCPDIQPVGDRFIVWRVEPQGVNSPTTFHMEFIWGLDPIPDNCPGTTLSPIAQAVKDEVGEQEYCGNHYDSLSEDRLITLPPGQDAFQKFQDLAETAIEPGPHEVDFVTMGWDPYIADEGTSTWTTLS
jgi:hypothetical protein